MSLLNTIGQDKPWLNECLSHGWKGTYTIYQVFFARYGGKSEVQVCRAYYEALQAASDRSRNIATRVRTRSIT